MASDMPCVHYIRSQGIIAERDGARPGKGKGRTEEYEFLELLEDRAVEMFSKVKNNGKNVSSNVDFYSGFVYEMIGFAGGNLHSSLCDGTYCRVDGSPERRAELCRKTDYPPGL